MEEKRENACGDVGLLSGARSGCEWKQHVNKKGVEEEKNYPGRRREQLSLQNARPFG